MIPGPLLIKECPHCLGSFKESSLGSGNTFGATFWTDGRCEAPMLPDQEWLLICPHCGAGSWSDELAVIAELDFYHGVSDKSLVQKYDQTEYAKTPSITDLHRALIKETADKKKTKYLRIKIWWTGNDIRRENPEEPTMTAVEVDNLVELIPLLGQDAMDREGLLMKAEALREMGKFDEALSVLDKFTGNQLGKAVAQIRQLVIDRDLVVRKMILS